MASLVDKLHPLVLNIGLAIHNADWNWKNVNSPFTRLYYVTEGTAQVLISGKTQILKANHMYFIPAFTKHSYSPICHRRRFRYNQSLRSRKRPAVQYRV